MRHRRPSDRLRRGRSSASAKIPQDAIRSLSTVASIFRDLVMRYCDVEAVRGVT